MAAAVATADMTILKNTQILVNVEEALLDILVVSYADENRRFQGVLLDSSKRNLPFGVSALHPAFALSQKCSNGTDDKLFSASQRFIYQDPDYHPKPLSKPKQRQQRSKMTVRLRPRKVLCSKCKGICNENSENVAQTRSSSVKDKKAYSSDSAGRSNRKEESRTLIMGHSLIPKISRLHPNEITNAMNGNAYARNEIWIQQSDVEKSDTNLDMDESSGKHKISEGSGDSDRSPVGDKSDTVYSSSDADSESRLREDGGEDSGSERRKRKSKIKDDNAATKRKRVENFPDGDMEETSGSTFSNPRTLKISFGEGEETVLKLPAASSDFGPVAGDSNSSRITKRALRKAKKARRRASPPPSPPHQPAYQIFQRRHKRKVKHKKKHRSDKTSNPHSASPFLLVDGDETILDHSAMKETRLTRKLTVNLQRLRSDVETGAGGDCEPMSGAELHTLGTEESWYAPPASDVPGHGLSPFLDNFQVRFNKKKRGPYEEDVVKQTSLEGRAVDPLSEDPLAAAPGSHMTPLSPPPIDVLS